MAYKPEHLEHWSANVSAFDSAANYCGADLSAFYVAPISNGRDTCDSVTLSNWRVISAELEKLAKHDESGVARFGHWAGGWYELWLIHESDAAALQCADQWAAELESYPVASESDLSELEQEEEGEAWERWAASEWRGVLTSALEPYAPDDAPYGWEDDQIDALSDDQIGEAWHLVADRLSWCCIHESDGPTFNFREAAEQLTAATLSEITGLNLLEPSQEWRREAYPWAGAEPAPLEPALA